MKTATKVIRFTSVLTFLAATWATFFFGTVWALTVMGVPVVPSWKALFAFTWLYLTAFTVILGPLLTAIAIAQPRKSAQNLRDVTAAVKRARAEEELAVRADDIGAQAEEFLRARRR